MDDSSKVMKDTQDKVKKLQELMEAKEDLAKVNECISFIEVNRCYDTRIFASFIQDVVDKYRGKVEVGNYYKSSTDQNLFASNYNSLLALRNMLCSYLSVKSVSDVIDEIHKDN